MKQPARIAVLASGGGTNLQALLDDLNQDPGAGGRVELVVGGRAGIGALERAERAGVEQVILSVPDSTPTSREALLTEALQTHQIDLIVLAGYLQLVPLSIVHAYHGRMINIHPALLPAFGGPGMYGLRVHQAVIETGAKVSGATVHYVEERYDEGKIIAQWPVPVLPDDTSETLAARVLHVEHILLPRAVRWLISGQAVQGPLDPTRFALTAGDTPASDEVVSLMSNPIHE